MSDQQAARYAVGDQVELLQKQNEVFVIGLVAEVRSVRRYPDGWRYQVACGWETTWVSEDLLGFTQLALPLEAQDAV